ncbi:MAG: cryptochrome/photolyase family protein, partial [Pseudomonadota bacterium]
MVKLILVLGDQLSADIAALKAADKSSDIVVMAEVADEAAYVPHHPKKIALIFAAMRKFADALCSEGWTVAYRRLDEPGAGSITGELLRRAEEFGTSRVTVTEPGEWRLIEALRDCPLDVEILEDDRFVATHAEFEAWAEGRKQLRMEYFYREMRRKTGLLMEGDQPVEGKWNFDHENRKPASADLFARGPLRCEPDTTTREVLDLVARRFGNSFGSLEPFWFATDRVGALAALDHFIAHHLAEFGAYQDAMLTEDRFLHHSLISFYINVGLLGPLEVCQRVAAEYEAGRAPINSAEGY